MAKVNQEELVSTKVMAYHEKLWRDKALTNSKTTFLNIQLFGM